MDSALELFDGLPKKGINLDIFTYTSLICGLCVFTRWSKVISLLENMIACKIQPDSKIFRAIFDDFCKAGLLDLARAVFGQMKQHNVKIHCQLVMSRGGNF